MKTTKKWLVALIVLLASLMTDTTIIAQANPGDMNQSPLQAVDVLREYALKKVTSGQRVVNAPSMIVGKADSNHIEVTGNGAEDVLDRLLDFHLTYKLANPDDTIQGEILLKDNNDNVLFQGYARYKAAEVGGKGGGVIYTLWLGNIPVLEDLNYAEYITQREDGSTAQRYPVEVKNGHAIISEWHVGKTNGLLYTVNKDGIRRFYRMDSGVPVEAPSLSDRAEWRINGHHVYRSTTGEQLAVEIVELWIRPTVLLVLSRDTEVTFDIKGLVQDGGIQVYEAPSALHYDGAGTIGILDLIRTKTYRFKPGSYRIRFQWENFGKPQRHPTQGSGDGYGKG